MFLNNQNIQCNLRMQMAFLGEYFFKYLFLKYVDLFVCGFVHVSAGAGGWNKVLDPRAAVTGGGELPPVNAGT